MSLWFRQLPLWVKTVVAVGGGLLIGCSTYVALALLEYRTRSRFDRLFLKGGSSIHLNGQDDKRSKRILFLGLDGAGKSSILAKFSKSEQTREGTTPTEGFNIVCVQTSGLSLNIWEVGGNPTVRPYWVNFLSDTNILVYVLDASDEESRLVEAIVELRKVLQDQRLTDVPVLVLANKQDKHGSKTAKEIEKLLTTHCSRDGPRPFEVMATHALAGKGLDSSITELEQWLTHHSSMK